MVLEKLEVLGEWAARTPQIGGWYPWHLMDRMTMPDSTRCDYRLGAVSMPSVMAKLREIGSGIVNSTKTLKSDDSPLPPQPWWAHCQPNASNGTTCSPCMNSGDCPHPKACPATVSRHSYRRHLGCILLRRRCGQAHSTCCHPKAPGPWLQGHCRCLPAVPIAPHSLPGFCPDPHPPPQPPPQPGPPSHPGKPVAHDIIVKSPSKLPASLPVLDRKDVIDMPYSNANLLTWGYKPWIARVPTTGELLMSYSAMGKTLLVIRRSNTSGASFGAPEVHPELSASPGARHNKTDQEWSIHVLHDATVLLNDGSCSMFRSTDLGRTFRAVHGEGGDPFHFNSTDGQSHTECPLPSPSQAAVACVQSAAPGACCS